MQMKLETNIPLIFLTLLVIAIVVLGYLELKKLNERIKILEYLNKEGKKKGNKEEKVKEVKLKEVKQEPVISGGEGEVREVQHGGGNNRVEEWQMNNEKEDIINTLNQKEEYIEEINNTNGTIFINPNEIYAQHPMMYREMGDPVTDDIIEQIRNDETVDFENNIQGEGIINDIGTMDNHVIMDDEETEEQIEVKVENESVHEGSVHEGSVHEGSVHEDTLTEEEIDLKEISDDDDFSKSKILVDESFSVNELKSICKNLGLQFSGNKSTLIKRIMDNQ
jgi:hypothetical protein